MSNTTVIILEDNKDHLEILSNKITSEGYEVIECSNPEEFKKLLETNGIDINLIITDVYFGDETIFDLLEIFSFYTNKYPFIIISAYSDEETILKAIHSGAMDYIKKEDIYTTNFNILISKVLRNWKNIKNADVSENKYRLLIEDAPVGIFYTSINGKLINLNKKTSDIFGFDSPTAFKKYLSDNDLTVGILYDNPNKRDEIIKFCLDNPNIWKQYDYIKFLDINKNELYLTMIIRYNSEENFLEGFLEDKTLEEQMIKDVQRSEARLNMALKASEDAVWDWDLKTGKTYFSPRFYTMLGYDADEFDQTFDTWKDLTHPDDILRSKRLIDEVLIGEKEFYEFEFRMKTKSGEWKWFLGKGMSIEYDEQGKALRMIGINSDIDQRKRDEISLFNEQKRLLTIFESIGDGIIVLSPHNKVEMINKSAEDILFRDENIDSIDLIDMDIKDFLYAMSNSQITLQDAIMLAKKNKKIVNLIDTDFFVKKTEFFNDKEPFDLTKWRKINIEDAVSPILNERNDVTGIVIAFRDITERIENIEKNKILQDQLNQSQKMEAFGQFSGGIAHDFNNILTVIYGYAESIKDQGLPEIDEIIKSCEKASDLTKKLLAFGRKQVISTEVLDLREIIEDMYGLLSRILEASITLEYDIKHTSNIRGDKTQLQQILVNFVVNARDAINSDEKDKVRTITVRTYDIDLEELRKRHLNDTNGFMLEEKNYVMIEVEDTGNGIPEENIPKIFDPFFSTKEKKNGTGLGLSTVYGIVRQNNGSILVHSEVGKGTLFTIFWPATDERVVSREDQKIEYEKQSKNTGKILFVEDESELISLVSAFLKKKGFEIDTAENGEVALEMYHPDKYDIIITDIIMPKMSGAEFIHLIKEEFPDHNPKVIYTTGYSNENIPQIKKEENIVFIQKPYSLKKLIDNIRSLLVK